MKTILTLLGGILIIPLTLLYNIFSWGYVTTIIYSWFIIPIYPEAPSLSLMEFGGIMLFLSCFFHSGESIKDEYKNKTLSWLTIILGPWLLLLLSWGFHLIY